MLGVVNRYWKHIVRSADDFFNKWLVTYDELPRDEEKFPGNSLEYYPDYIGALLSRIFGCSLYNDIKLQLVGSWW